MGEEQASLFGLDFNRSVRVEARPERLTSDAGAVLLRSLLDRLGWAGLVREYLRDPRDGQRLTHSWVDLLRTQVLLQAQGWTEQRDVELLRGDPALRLAVSSRAGLTPLGTGGLASQPTLSRLLAALSSRENRSGLSRLLLDVAGRRGPAGAGVEELTLDLDSLPIEVWGSQPGSERNGHYHCRCYHPLVVRGAWGDFLGAQLRPGRVHTSAGALEFVLPVLRWAKARAGRVWLRMDAGFPHAATLDALEAEDVRYVARVRGTRPLEKLAAPHLDAWAEGPPGPEELRSMELSYRSQKWSRPRRLVLVGVTRADAQHELFLDHFFLVTNVAQEEVDGPALVAHYRQRGEAERDFGDWKSTLEVALSSTPRPKTHYRGQAVQTRAASPDSFAANEARLLLSVLAANLLRAGAELVSRGERTLLTRQRFRQLVLKAAGRVLVHGRRITVVIEAARAPLWRRFWREMNRLYPVRGSPQTQALPTPA